MTCSQMQLPFQRRLLSNNAMPGKKIRCVICYYAKITDILSFLDIFVYNNNNNNDFVFIFSLLIGKYFAVFIS